MRQAEPGRGACGIPYRHILDWGGFHDVPRAALIEVDGRLIQLTSDFDDNLDEYQHFYTVAAVVDAAPAHVVTGLFGRRQHEVVPLGRLPIAEAGLDPTRRRYVRSAAIEAMLASATLPPVPPAPCLPSLARHCAGAAHVGPEQQAAHLQVLCCGARTDAPRWLLLAVGEQVVHLVCRFDVSRGEYTDRYDASLITNASVDDLYTGAYFEREPVLEALGQVPLADVRFHPTWFRYAVCPAIEAVVSNLPREAPSPATWRTPISPADLEENTDRQAYPNLHMAPLSDGLRVVRRGLSHRFRRGALVDVGGRVVCLRCPFCPRTGRYAAYFEVSRWSSIAPNDVRVGLADAKLRGEEPIGRLALRDVVFDHAGRLLSSPALEDMAGV